MPLKETATQLGEWRVMGVRVHPVLHRQFKTEAARLGVTMTDLVHAAFCIFLGRADLLPERPNAPDHVKE
jgi:hypothetical protein